jgi:hypothetical protein
MTTAKEHYKEEQHDRRLYTRQKRATRATNYVRDGKTYSSSGREDLMFSSAGDTKAQARKRSSQARRTALKRAKAPPRAEKQERWMGLPVKKYRNEEHARMGGVSETGLRIALGSKYKGRKNN